MIRLILIRHGETHWTSQKRYQGHSDTRLTARGRSQARVLAKSLAAQKIDVLYTSSLGRAKETGSAISRKIGKRPRMDSRLNELSFGRWEGKTAKELARAKDRIFRRWCQGKLIKPPAGESLSSLRKRVSAFLKQIEKRHPGKTVALVSHGGTTLCAIASISPSVFSS